MNALGFGQRLGETSVLGIGVVTQNYGDLPITTTEIPGEELVRLDRRR